MRWFFPIILIFCLLVPSFMVWADKPNVTIDILLEQNSVRKNGSVDIAIRQNIIDKWHTYWLNPGDSGEAMTIDWTLPKGVSVSEIKEPVPERLYYDPLVNFGHKGQPIFIQTISLDDDFSDNDLNMKGTAYWLVCDDICIPESQNISITLPISETPQKINQAIFNKAKASVPEIVDWDATLSKQDNDVVLNVAVPTDLHNQMVDVDILPHDWGIIQTTSAITSDIGDDTVTFTALSDTRDWDTLKNPRFVIKTGNGAYEVQATIIDTASPQTSHNIFYILFFAFIGGLILNLMPCVFPVLSMKALSLVKLSDKERHHARANGLAYTVGVVGSFVLIAGTLMVLKGAGESIGWGFQLQNPYVVTILATLLFIIGLNLMGLFEINGRFVNIGSKLTQGNNTKSSFFTGVLATLVATPCTAPFMATAIGYALTQSSFIGLFVFAMLGFGLAFPYLMLTFVPATQRILPRPGAWMDTFKQVLAFPMFASVIWLVWVLAQQVGDMAILYILALFLAIIFMIWFARVSKSKLFKGLVLLLFIVIFGFYSALLKPNSSLSYEPFDNDKLEKILAEKPKQPVFVNMTAAWCITCLMNERTSLSNADVEQAFKNQNVIYMKGDWTNRDAKITQYLEQFERNGVPLYVYYAPALNESNRPAPFILPQILTPNIILDTIKGE